MKTKVQDSTRRTVKYEASEACGSAPCIKDPPHNATSVIFDWNCIFVTRRMKTGNFIGEKLHFKN